MSHSAALERFCDFFNKLDNTCTEKLYEVYTEDIVFRDPLHTIEGRTALQAYFANMYANVTQCQFTYHDSQLNGDIAWVSWTMTFAHAKLAGGRAIEVEGCSRLNFARDGRVSSHRDYLDAGAMLYENLPVLGRLIRFIKQRAAA